MFLLTQPFHWSLTDKWEGIQQSRSLGSHNHGEVRRNSECVATPDSNVLWLKKNRKMFESDKATAKSCETAIKGSVVADRASVNTSSLVTDMEVWAKRRACRLDQMQTCSLFLNALEFWQIRDYSICLIAHTFLTFIVWSISCVLVASLAVSCTNLLITL
jgi:hypothetical protein